MKTLEESLYEMFFEKAIEFADIHCKKIFIDNSDKQTDEWLTLNAAYNKGAIDAIEFIFENYNISGQKTPDENLKIKTPKESAKIAEILKNKLTDTNRFSTFNIDEIYPDISTNDKMIKARLYVDELYPNPTINDRITEAHSYVNNLLTKVALFKESNNAAIHLLVITKLKERIGNVEVICDETNNTPEAVDSKIVIAKVMWTDNNIRKYQDLFFGEEYNITKFLLNHMEYRNNENIF